MILPCSCKHDWQDGQYGKGNRVHNLCKGGSKARCGVCLNEKPVKGAEAEVKKPKAKK